MASATTAFRTNKSTKELVEFTSAIAKEAEKISCEAFATLLVLTNSKNRSWKLHLKKAEKVASVAKELARQAELSASDVQEVAPDSEASRDARRYALDALEASAIASAVAHVLRQKATYLV